MKDIPYQRSLHKNIIPRLREDCPDSEAYLMESVATMWWQVAVTC